MLKIRSLYSIMLLSFLFVISSCSNDNECDNVCPNGTLQLLDCTCLELEGPCEGVVCATGEILTSNCDCIVENASTVLVNYNISTNQTWTSDKIWILSGRVAVTNEATLTIEPGTVIKGEAGAQANSSALLIARGAKIEANGTEFLPIVFTSVADELTPADIASGNYASPNLEPSVNGLWGGIIILGNAPISAQNESDQDIAELQIEGIPTSDSNGLYGGSNEFDSSGSLTYVSIRHGGTNIGEGNEINGLTLGGVGSETTINNIEVVANQDDGIEWFGGTVSVENVLIWNCGDDGLDTDQGWNGTCENWIVALPQGGSGLELDGPEGTFTQGCNTFENGIIYGGAKIDDFIDWDDNTNSAIVGLYIFGIESPYDPKEGIESFGGDGACDSENWEYSTPSEYESATFFDNVEMQNLSSINLNANTYGPNSDMFNWTWGGASGVLSGMGI